MISGFQAHPYVKPGRRWRGLNPRQKGPCRSQGRLASHCATDAPIKRQNNFNGEEESTKQMVRICCRSFERRHGTNPCDALDGVLKQAASRAVNARQVTIQNAYDLHSFAVDKLTVSGDAASDCQHLSRSFCLFSVDEPTTANVAVPIEGTRQLHSPLPTRAGFRVRSLSCFCDACRDNTFDDCHNKSKVSDWKSVRDWEKRIKKKRVVQKKILEEKESLCVANESLNNAFLKMSRSRMIVTEGI
ncbi:hypothetical protein PoB_006012200 [Plakobranchus ocellatus]|uniref:Uncharacterized protein n=1 Tax=Plakobranchus ocellatus TaxID=259542 RepID=A0AAV4CP03_9GAST|nr:hypothetical protein PoB_006012200 [Plakobranchus ocellatus]